MDARRSEMLVQAEELRQLWKQYGGDEGLDHRAKIGFNMSRMLPPPHYQDLDMLAAHLEQQEEKIKDLVWPELQHRKLKLPRRAPLHIVLNALNASRYGDLTTE